MTLQGHVPVLPSRGPAPLAFLYRLEQPILFSVGSPSMSLELKFLSKWVPKYVSPYFTYAYYIYIYMYTGAFGWPHKPKLPRTLYMGGCQNYEPFSWCHIQNYVPYYDRDPKRDHNFDNHPYTSQFLGPTHLNFKRSTPPPQPLPQPPSPKSSKEIMEGIVGGNIDKILGQKMWMPTSQKIDIMRV